MSESYLILGFAWSTVTCKILLPDFKFVIRNPFV